MGRPGRAGVLAALAIVACCLPLSVAAAPPPAAAVSAPGGPAAPDPVRHLAIHGASSSHDRPSIELGAHHTRGDWSSHDKPTAPRSTARPVGRSVPAPASPEYHFSGHVVGPSGEPLQTYLTFWPWQGGAYTQIFTAVDGSFDVLLVGGKYIVQVDGAYLHAAGFWGPSGFNYLSGAVDPLDMTVADVSATITDPNNITLSGRVTPGLIGGQVVEVDIFHANALSTTAYAGSDGYWSATVPPGAYEIGYYRGSTAYGDGWLGVGGYTPDPNAARVVSVAANVDVGSVVLPATHSVSGTLYRPSGTGQAGATIEAWVDGSYYAQTTTSSTGAYTLHVPTGMLTLWEFEPTAQLAPGWRTSTSITANPASATKTSVSTNMTGLNIHAPTATLITGHVYWMAGSPTTQSGIYVEADAFSTATSAAVTDGSGNFKLPILPGSYLVWIDGHLINDLVAGTYYVSGGLAQADYALGTTVTVASGAHPSISIEVPLAIQITGEVDASYGPYFPLINFEVQVYVNGHFYLAGEGTGGYQNNFLIVGMAPGTYRLAVVDLEDDYVAGWWANTYALVPDYTSAIDVYIPVSNPVLSVEMAIGAPPSAPTGVTATPYHDSARVAWQPVPTTANRPIWGYVVTASPGGEQCIAYATTTCTVDGLTDGTSYTFTVRAASQVGVGSESAPSAGVQPLAVPEAPTGVTLAVAKSQATISWSAAIDNGNAVTGYTVSASPGGYHCSTSGALQCAIAALPDGLYSFSVTASNSLGSGPASAPVQARVDTVIPSIGAPTATPSVGSSIGSTIPVKLTWSGSDSGSGISKYEVWLSTNGGSYVLVSSPATATYTRALTPSSTTTYRFRVRAFDKSGNVSAFAYGATFHVKLVQQTSTSVHWYGTWYTVATSSASGGSYRYTSVAGRYVYYTFTGRAVGVVATTSTGYGSFKVYLDGVYVGSASDYSTSTAYRKLIYSKTWSTSATHTIKLVCSGTSGHPRIDVDAFVVLG